MRILVLAIMSLIPTFSMTMAKEEIKEFFYRYQTASDSPFVGLDRESYFKCLDPFLEEAAKTLPLYKQLLLKLAAVESNGDITAKIERLDLPTCTYLICVQHCSVDFFRYFSGIQPQRELLIKTTDALYDAIHSFAKYLKVDINVAQEFEKTKNLLLRATNEYMLQVLAKRDSKDPEALRTLIHQVTQ